MYVRKCTDNSTPLRDTGHNIASDTHATRGDLTVLQSDGLCGGVSVAMHSENICCDSKPDKNVDDLASLDPLNIARDYAAGYMDRPLQRRLRGAKTTLIPK